MVRKETVNSVILKLIICLVICSYIMLHLPKYAYAEAGVKVNIGKKKLDMYAGQTYKFKNKKYSWKSSRKSVVSVDKKGRIKAKKPGTAKITAGLKIGRKTGKAVCNVKVGKYAERIKLLSANTIILKSGQTNTVNAKVMPDKVLYNDMEYSSDNVNVAAVDGNGTIRAVSKGTATVSMVTKAVNAKGKKVMASVTVVVMEDDNKVPTATPMGRETPSFTPEPTNPDVTIKPDITPEPTPTSVVTPEPTPEPVIVPTPTSVVTPEPTPEPVIVPTPTSVVIPESTPEPTIAPTPTSAATPESTIAPTPTSVVTPEPTPEPTIAPTPTSVVIPESTPEPTIAPTPTPAVTPEPTPTLTIEPTPVPAVIVEYIASLKPDNTSPLVGSFTFMNSNDEYRTVYLLDKNYSGTVKLDIDGYIYSGDNSVISLLKRLETERIKATNSSGTICVHRTPSETLWTVEFLQTGVKYCFDAKVNDTMFESDYGIIIAEGNTLEHIKISAR